MDELTVIGIDLAYKTWGDVGSATLTFVAGDSPAWRAGRVDVIAWPGGQLSPAAMAEAIDRFAGEVKAVAVSIDGPQGWRDPHAVRPKGVGRWCDYEARTPGKTGVFGRVYPGTYTGWVTFSVAVFADLLARPYVTLANDPTATRLDPPPAGHYYLLECFPTSTWRASGLGSLPGHRKAPPAVVSSYADALQRLYDLPESIVTGHHDHLQAVVAALPAAGLLGGPCKAIARGEPARCEPATPDTPAHLVEGIIWDAAPLSTHGSVMVKNAASTSARLHQAQPLKPAGTNVPAIGRPVATASTQVSSACLCGCGGLPKRGRFLPGHDAKLKGALLRRARHGDSSALAELRQLGWDHFLKATPPNSTG